MTLTIDKHSAKIGLLEGGWYNALLAKPSSENHQLTIEPINSERVLLDSVLLMAKSVRTGKPTLVVSGIMFACEIRVFIDNTSSEVGSKKFGRDNSAGIIDLLRLDRHIPAGAGLKLQIIPAR